MQAYQQTVEGTGLFGFFKRVDKLYLFAGIEDMFKNSSGLSYLGMIPTGHREDGFIENLALSQIYERDQHTALFDLEGSGRTILAHTGRAYPQSEMTTGWYPV